VFWESPPLDFVRRLEHGAAGIREEARALPEALWLEWPDRGAYSQGWSLVPLFTQDEREPLGWSCGENALRCPLTLSVLRAIPGLRRAAFSQLAPGTHIYLHRDQDDDHLRCHLALWSNPQALLRLDGFDVHWREGRCLVFEGDAVHEAANLGERPRVVLLLDVLRASLPRHWRVRGPLLGTPETD